MLMVLIVYLVYSLNTVVGRRTGKNTPANSDINLKEEDIVLIKALSHQNSSAPPNFNEHGQRLRLYKTMYDSRGSLSKMDESLLATLTRHLFPWLSESLVFQIRQSPLDSRALAEKGIVICSYDRKIDMTMTLIQVIRIVYKSNLPIEVYFAGNEDLSIENQQSLQKIDGVRPVDITKIFDNDLLKLKRWAIKPFALLASGFEKVILMDCDVVLFQSPEAIFEQPGFKASGALFFHDRSMNDEIKDWSKAREIAIELTGQHISSLSKLRFFNGKTNYEMESGVVVIDKTRNIVGLLAICSLNTLREREILYQVTYGEKETFWMGFEAVHIDYDFNNHMPGVIGKLSGKTPERVCCKQILHLDYLGQPLWLNGGLYAEKSVSKGFLKMEHYGVETDSTGEWVRAGNGDCLDLVTPHSLAVSQLQLIEDIRLISSQFEK